MVQGGKLGLNRPALSRSHIFQPTSAFGQSAKAAMEVAPSMIQTAQAPMAAAPAVAVAKSIRKTTDMFQGLIGLQLTAMGLRSGASYLLGMARMVANKEVEVPEAEAATEVPANGLTTTVGLRQAVAAGLAAKEFMPLAILPLMASDTVTAVAVAQVHRQLRGIILPHLALGAVALAILATLVEPMATSELSA